MGVEYIHYLLPKDHAFQPSPQQLEKLIAGLYSGSWLCRPDSAEFSQLDFSCFCDFELAGKTGGFRREPQAKDSESIPYPATSEWFAARLPADLLLVWPIYGFEKCRSLRYPFDQSVGEETEIYFEIKLQIAENYLHRVSEIFDPLSNVDCKCGASLEFYVDAGPFFDGRIHKNCPKCGTFFDPGDVFAVCRDVWTGFETEVAGGATSCFALAIDCGKAIPNIDSETAIRIHPDLKKVVEETLGVMFYELGNVY